MSPQTLTLNPQPGRGPVVGSPDARPPARALRVLALIPDAFGSHGGISKFNRDLLTALCAHPDCAEVVAIPRLMSEPPGPLPSKLTWATDGLGGKLRYLSAALKVAKCKPSRQSTTLSHRRSRCPAVFSSSSPEMQPPTTNSQPSAEPSPSFDLVICGHINLLPAAFLARRRLSRVSNPSSRGRASVPLALFMHGIEVWDPHRSFLVRSLARRVDAFVSVSAFTWDRFLQWARVSVAKGFRLPNCVDLAGFQPGEKDPALLKKYGLDDKKVLMTLGRLLPGRPKGIDEVMELLPELSKEVPQVAYLVVGDGPDRGRLAAKAVQLGIGDRVAFSGRVPESEKAAHYRLADAFVMPGYGEGFGIVYLEALACGIPVLASTLDASREALLNGELGLLVDPRNCIELLQGLRDVLQRPRERVPSGLEYFSFSNFVKRCHAIVDNLCPAAMPRS